MSPWSYDEKVAQDFAGNGYLNSANMLAKYIFMYSYQPNFITEFEREAEYLILETAALEKSHGTESPAIGYRKSKLYEWTIKQLNHKRENGTSMFDESNGVIDYSFSSAYEPQYDIFYNYRKKPNAKSTAKELMHRIKKLHNK
jgi:hypothetical protein